MDLSKLNEKIYRFNSNTSAFLFKLSIEKKQ